MNLRKFFAAAFAAVVAAGCGAIGAQAASLPHIQIHPSGSEHQYIITLKNVESTVYGVQFDVTVDSSSEVEVQWADQHDGVVQEAVQQVQGNRTTITFYVSKTYPLSNSTQVQIAAITTEKEQKETSFHTSGKVKTVDGRQQPVEYSGVGLTFQPAAEAPGSSGDTDDWEDRDSSEEKRKENMLSWDKLSSKVKTENGKKTLAITAKNGQRLESEIFRQALAKGIDVTVNYGDYQWVFHGAEGGSVPEKQKYYDLTVQFMGQKNLSDAAHHSDILQFSVAHSGKLPCPGTLKLSVDSRYKGQTLYLALYNEFAGTLEKYAQAVAGEDGSIAFTLEQGGKYVVVTEDLWAVSAPTGTAGSQTAAVTVPPLETEEEQKEDQPQAEPEEEEQPQEPEAEKTAGPKDAQREKKEISVAGVLLTVACVAAFGGAVSFFTIKDKKPSHRHKK